MEIALSVFLGLWISAAGVCAYIWLKKEFKPWLKENEKASGGRTNE
jgi:hypothetical protein